MPGMHTANHIAKHVNMIDQQRVATTIGEICSEEIAGTRGAGAEVAAHGVFRDHLRWGGFAGVCWRSPPAYVGTLFLVGLRKRRNAPGDIGRKATLRQPRSALDAFLCVDGFALGVLAPINVGGNG